MPPSGCQQPTSAASPDTGNFPGITAKADLAAESHFLFQEGQLCLSNKAAPFTRDLCFVAPAVPFPAVSEFHDTKEQIQNGNIAERSKAHKLNLSGATLLTLSGVTQSLSLEAVITRILFLCHPGEQHPMPRAGSERTALTQPGLLQGLTVMLIHMHKVEYLLSEESVVPGLRGTDMPPMRPPASSPLTVLLFTVLSDQLL